jgi:hypothetical protein
MGGYTIEVPETERAVDMLTGNATQTHDADTGISTMPKLPAVQAGESIASDVAAFVSGWHEALDDVHNELTGLAKNVDTSKNVTVKVEQEVGNRFARFN